MEVVIDIMLILLPVIIAGGIAVFVIKKLKHKYEQGTLGKRDTKGAQTVLDSLIPLFMLAGCSAGIILGIYVPAFLPASIGLGAGAGLLVGYFAYDFYSKESYT